MMKDIKRIYNFEEIKHMVDVAPEFFPQDQEMLDAFFMCLIDGFCYAGIKKIHNHPSIAVVEIISDRSAKKTLQPSLFVILLSLVKSLGFSRMSMRFKNERIKHICLKKGWVVPWGLGLYVNKESV